MQKTPTYIGIFATDPKDAAKKLTAFSKECLELLIEEAKRPEVEDDLMNFDTKFTLPKDNHHITTLYIGGN